MRRSTLSTTVLVTGAALVLTSCMGGGGGATPTKTPRGESQEGSGGAGVSFEEVQSATVQIEAVGTFVDPAEGAFEAAGRGSGLIIDPSGIIVTNNHVVTGAGTLKVWVGDGESEPLNAEVLGVSECLDLAVIDLEGDGYPFFDWYEGDITTGQDVYSAGFPLGDPTFTLTRGIVSKADTTVETQWASPGSVIEHDARIRGGNSGGPLITADGQVVGVNYAGDDVNDINLAIHRDEVLPVIEAMQSGESVESLGINGQALVTEDGMSGIWVNSVQSGSPADVTGVKPGDYITQMEGVTLGTDGTLADYCDVVRTHGNDGVISLELLRPEEGAYYQGQFNGDALEAISIAPVEGGQAGGEESYGEYVTVTDDTGSVLVEVPAAWTDVDGGSYTDPHGNLILDIRASTDLQGMNSTWEVPGATVSVSADGIANGSLTPESLYNDILPVTAACSGSGGRTDYADGAHTGFYELFTGCGGTADYLVLVANADDGSYVVWVTAQAVSAADYEAIDRVLGSFIASVV